MEGFLVKNSLKLSVLSASMLTLIGCASQAVDTTPKVDVSVIETNIRTGGYLLPDGNISEIRYTTANKTLVESKNEYDSWITGKLLGDGHLGEVTRLDKKLIWNINYKTESYMECALSGCTSLNPWAQLESEEEPEEDAYDPSGSEACPVKVVKYDFTVTPKDKGRQINGFKADQYVAQWDVVSEDSNGNQDKHVVTMDYWMADTSNNQSLQIAHDFDKRYYDMVIAQTPLAQIFNDNVAKLMELFSAGKEAELKKLTSVGGEAISAKLEWYADVNTCPTPEVEKQKSSFDANDPLGSLQTMAGDFLSDQAEKKAKSWMGLGEGKPVLTVMSEVKKASMSAEHESRFEVPEGFKITDRQ